MNKFLYIIINILIFILILFLEYNFNKVYILLFQILFIAFYHRFNLLNPIIYLSISCFIYHTSFILLDELNYEYPVLLSESNAANKYNLAIIMISTFNIGMIFAGLNKANDYRITSQLYQELLENTKKFKNESIFIITLSIQILSLIITYFNVSIMKSTNYHVKTSDHANILINSSSFFLLSLFFLFLYLFNSKKKFLKKILFLFSLFTALIFVLFQGERGPIFFLIISLLFFYYSLNKINKYQTLLALLILIFLTTIMQSFKLIGINNIFYEGPNTLEYFKNLFSLNFFKGIIILALSTEFKTSSQALLLVLSNYDFISEANLAIGLIINIARGLLPSILFGNNFIENTLIVFNNEFSLYSEWGLGFSLIAESIYNFRLVGPIIYGFFYLKIIYYFYEKSQKNLIFFSIYIILIPKFIFVFRMDTAFLVSTIFNFAIIPYIIFYILKKRI